LILSWRDDLDLVFGGDRTSDRGSNDLVSILIFSFLVFELRVRQIWMASNHDAVLIEFLAYLEAYPGTNRSADLIFEIFSNETKYKLAFDSAYGSMLPVVRRMIGDTSFANDFIFLCKAVLDQDHVGRALRGYAQRKALHVLPCPRFRVGPCNLCQTHARVGRHRE
jgi:hypothetical protein